MGVFGSSYVVQHRHYIRPLSHYFENNKRHPDGSDACAMVRWYEWEKRSSTYNTRIPSDTKQDILSKYKEMQAKCVFIEIARNIKLIQ